MTIKAFIVDDEKKNIEILNHFLERFCEGVKVIGTARSVKETIKLLDEQRPDLIFLDIELGNSENAFDLLELLAGSDTLVVIVTAYREYGYEAFKFNVTDYLLKPVSIKELQKTIDKVTKQLTGQDRTLGRIGSLYEQPAIIEKSAGIIAIPANNEIFFIKIEDIISLKADGKYTIFNLTEGKKVISSKNILEYQRSLPTQKFIRTHHSYIINVTRIKKVDKSDGWICIMSDDTSIPVSRRRREEFLSRIII